ncbi:MAG: Flp family type IVb pilin [Acidimicrobiia bacterium]
MDLTFVASFIAQRFQQRLKLDDRGASLVEYALLVALIAVLCIAALRFLSGRVSSGLSNSGSSIG